ncbi:hypothetical protein BX600DRAFT_505469 [Xylariales sp. PMI_506]|nr:hypothetical protein BX600DRAFT_505469 [Xylariales sp. PMI_506]
MRYSSILPILSLASAVLSSPIAAEGKSKRQLLNDLSPDVVSLLEGLGLTPLAQPVGDTLDTLGTDIKRGSDDGWDGANGTDGLSSEVIDLLNSLGLGDLIGRDGTLNLDGVSSEIIELLQSLGLGDLTKRGGGDGSWGNTDDTVSEITDLLNSLGLGDLINGNTLDLDNLSSDIIDLLQSLGLGELVNGGTFNLDDLPSSIIDLLNSLGLGNVSEQI